MFGRLRVIATFLQLVPHGGVVRFSVAGGEGGVPNDFALDRAGGERGVRDGAFDRAGLQGADFVPLGAWEADAGEAF